MNSFLINPFDAIGKIHNEGLDYVAGKLSSVPKIDEVVRLSSEFACKQWRADGSFSKGELASMSSVVSFAIIHLNDTKSLYQQTELNQQQIVFLEKMLCVNPYIKLEDQRERYRQIEGDIFSYPMSFKEKELLLIASSVGKYSGEYWNTQINEFDSKWKRFFPTPDNPSGPLARKKWATEDAKGAVGGAIGGAIGGAVTGPGGAVVGGVLGAIGGCIGASVASLLFD